MFSKLFQKPVKHKHHKQSAEDAPKGLLTSTDLDPRVILHYGIPSTASVLAFDPIQSLLAVGTLDGRIKVIGGENIEGLLISPKPLPYKHLEFLHNQGFLVGVSNDNEIQVWDLEHRQIATSMQWESNITAFSVIFGTCYMYIGSEYGMVAVLKYNAEDGKLVQSLYCISTNVIAEATGVVLPSHLSVVGVLHQPHSPGNRVLIAYENGLIVLWDASEDRVVLVRGHKDLDLKIEDVDNSSKDTRQEPSDDARDHEEVDKEISALCWVTSDGSVLAVGYVDGDILFWNMSTDTSIKDQRSNKLPSNVVKLQLSSSDRRLPVIVLHWSASRSRDQQGNLFVYGGDEIGSIEVLTNLRLDWSSGIENLKCVGRVDLALNGSFADMVISPNLGADKSSNTSLFVLTSPGQLHTYDDTFLSSLMARQEKTSYASPVQHPMVVPNVEPCITVAKLGSVCREDELSRTLAKIALSTKLEATQTRTSRETKWPLTGGIPCQLWDNEDYQVERVYIAGYQDGSIKIWDATYPVLSLIFHLESEVKDIQIAGASASVSALDFCSTTLKLAVGNECGLVSLYKLVGSSDETSLHSITESGNEVRTMHRGEGPQCATSFSLLNSCVCTLQFVNSGASLAVGFECGRVAMIDIKTLSTLFLTDDVTNSSSPVISLAINLISDASGSITSPKDPLPESVNNPGKEIVVTLTRNSQIVSIDGATGDVISSQSICLEKELTAVSLYIIGGDDLSSELSAGKQSPNIPQISGEKDNIHCGSTPHEVEINDSMESTRLKLRFDNLNVLICCETALHLYSLKSVIEGDSTSIKKVNLTNSCCWTTTFVKDGKDCGLIVLYQNGVIELRSLPSLEVLGESSLMSILRWNFKTNMDKTISSSDNGQIALLNGCEFAFISLLACENDFRIQESLSCLHDKYLASAAESNLSPNQHKTQSTAPGILDGVIKGFKALKSEYNVDHKVWRDNDAHLESLFSHPPFSKPPKDVDQHNLLELDLDDIKIDEPVTISSTSKISKNEKKDKGTERERLFDGSSTDTKTKVRTPEEIKAKYRHAGDASAAAALAKDKLVQRREKLDRLSQRTEDLKNGAENFADMAKELAKRMENRKWWNI